MLVSQKIFISSLKFILIYLEFQNNILSCQLLMVPNIAFAHNLKAFHIFKLQLQNMW